MSVEKQLVPETDSIIDLLRSPAMAVVYGATALVFSGDALEVASESYLRRGALPEPFDIASHIGNFREGGMATMAAGAMIAIVAVPTKVMENPRSEQEIKKRARISAVGGFFASCAVQVLGEAYGLTNSVVEANTPDMLDAAYGIGWSAVIAGVAYRSGLRFMRRNGLLESARPTDTTF